MKTKLKAFTLSELLVVLVVASLVISMTVLVLELIQKQMQRVRFGFQETNEVRLFEKLLVNDFNQREMIYDDNKKLLFGISEADTLQYHFFSNSIVRNTDTLWVVIHEKNFYLDNQQVLNGAVDALDVVLKKDRIFVYKTKSASHYMQTLWLSK